MNPNTDQSERLAQVVQNFFLKCAHVIAQSRAWPPLEPSGKINRWFNLELDEVLRDELRPWRTNLMDEDMPPLVVETFVDPMHLAQGQALVLAKPGGHSTSMSGATGPSATTTGSSNKEVVLERWIIEFRPRGDAAAVPSEPLDLPVVYKRAIVTIRALYTLVRLLPAWQQLRQRLTRQKLAAVPLGMGVRVLNGSLPISSRGRVGLSKPFGQAPAALSQYQLTPLQIPTGTLHVGVSYRTNVQFGVEDAEKVLAQQFLELDRPTSQPLAGSGAGSTHESSSLSLSASRRPILSFTRPFRSPDPHSSVTSLVSDSPQPPPVRRTPSTSSMARLPSGYSQQPVQPVPVPPMGSATGTSEVAAGSASSRFSSSFASRPGIVPRSSSIESRARPLSITSAHSLGAHSLSGHSGHSVGSITGSGEPGSGLYVAQEDVGEFVKFVDDTSRRLGQGTGFKGRQASPSAVDSSLARFHTLRASHAQLSDSILQSTTLRKQRTPSGGEPSSSAADGMTAQLVSRPLPPSGQSSPAPGNLGGPSSNPSSIPEHDVAGMGGTESKSSPAVAGTMPSPMLSGHPASVPTRGPTGLGRRRRSSNRSRLSFYTEDVADVSKDRVEVPEDDDSDHELLFAMSDMHT